jgi:Ca2+-binding EF-hand superfamily protein
MKVLVFGLCCGMLLAISAIADERPRDAWFSALDHNGNGSVSLNELQAVRNKKFYLLDINADGQITAREARKFQHKAMKQASNKKVSK